MYFFYKPNLLIAQRAKTKPQGMPKNTTVSSISPTTFKKTEKEYTKQTIINLLTGSRCQQLKPKLCIFQPRQVWEKINQNPDEIL